MLTIQRKTFGRRKVSSVEENLARELRAAIKRGDSVSISRAKLALDRSVI